MDWNKANNILLVALLAVNIFLIAVYGSQYVKKETVQDADVQQYTMSVLEENNIFYEGEKYEKTKKMRPLTVSYGKYDEYAVKQAYKNMRQIPENERTKEAYCEMADQLLEKCGYMNSYVQRKSVKISGDTATVSYRNVYEKIPVEECTMKVCFENGKINDFDRKWIEILSEREAKIEVMSQYSALLKFMTEVDHSSKIVVSDMYLTYWIDSNDMDGNVLSDTALPAWCFEYNDGKKKYISATVE